MKTWTKIAALALLALAGCRTPKNAEGPRDYEGVRRRAGEAHSAHDAQDKGMQDADAQ